MIGNNFQINRRKKVKCSACRGLTHISRMRPFPKMSSKRPSLEKKKPTFAEKNIPDAEMYNSDNYEAVMRQNEKFHLPQLIRIKATDREGNSIEVIY
ncbi:MULTISPECIES: hypothetical protein [unclassified Methanosarcina]|uniref:hypothetical protein n=1 Tax=unclassified Methanosarcina TaxID=2644672 RepID=UPI00064EA82C|nr:MULTISPECIES: hypothetical protein [unclassified Methanosarcina]